MAREEDGRPTRRTTDSFQALDVPVVSERAPSPPDPTGTGTPRRRRRSWVQRAGLVVLAVLLLLGPLFGYLAYRLTRDAEHERLAAAFQDVLSDRARRLSESVLSYVEMLHSLRALFYASEEVTRDEFSTFTHEARSRHPTLASIAWAPRVPAAARGEEEQRIRDDGFPGYSIHRRDGASVGDPSPGLDAYFPITYVEPLGPSEPALGWDIASDPTLRRALGEAIDANAPVLSDPLPVGEGPDPPLGAALLLRVVAPGGGGAVPPRLLGMVLLQFRFADLMQGLAGPSLDRQATPITLDLVDTDVEQRPVVVYRYRPDDAGDGGGFRAEETLTIGSQTWVLQGHPTERFLASRRGPEPILLAILVFVLWEAFAGALLALARYWRSHALHRQARLVHSVLRSLGEGVVVADRDGRIRLVNEAALRLLGAGSAGSWIDTGAPWKGLYLEDGRAPCAEDRMPLARAVRGERFRDQVAWVQPDGSSAGTWLSISATPLLDEWSEFKGGVVVLRDITEQKRSREERERLSNAVEQTADAVFITDRAGTILYVNPAFEASTGWTKGEAVGKTPRILKSGRHDLSYYTRLWGTILRGEVFRGTTVNRRKNGDVYYVEQTVTPIRDASGEITHFVSVCRDMTERRRIQEQEVEMRIAAQVQQRLYPRTSPSIPGLDIAGTVLSAEATCGDYFDYLDLPDGMFGIAIGDVCGHGLGPALVMAETRAYLRSLIASGLDLAEVCRRINVLLLGDLTEQFFVTLLLVGIGREDHSLIWANAGHTPAYLMDAAGHVRAKLGATGTPLGLFPDAVHPVVHAPSLDVGDVLLLVTDGAPESQAPDGRFLEEEGVLEVLREHRHEDAPTIVREMRRALGVFSGGRPPRDDVTLVVVKATPVAGPPSEPAQIRSTRLERSQRG